MIEVFKFGGTSVGSAEAIKMGKVIVDNNNSKKIVVVSAIAGVTDKLVEIIHSLYGNEYHQATAILHQLFEKHIKIIDDLQLEGTIKEILSKIFNEKFELILAIQTLQEMNERLESEFLALGEEISSLIISEYYKLSGIKTYRIDSRELIKTQLSYLSAQINFQLTNRLVYDLLNEYFKRYDCIICGGFYGSNDNGETTVLGRGGSDYSAAVLSSAIKADKLLIYTDVSGIKTADPRICKNAVTIEELSYREATELATAGAKVLHPKTIAPAVENDIPVFVLNTFKPNETGTLISNSKTNSNYIKALAFRKNLVLIKLYLNEEFKPIILSKINDFCISINTNIIIQQMINDEYILLCEQNENIGKLLEEIRNYGAINSFENLALISCIGLDIFLNIEEISKYINTLNQKNMQIIHFFLTSNNLNIVIPENILVESAEIIHEIIKKK